ncbi:uncharacterized protein LOC135837340 [Planococcus citri]|uniref:uncharacterized protein LOC135837340 n=1 Tax=Planococcus citri TaxID=170843 RepID=UPI0031F987B1
MIRNVHGDLILDFGAAQEKPVELKFKIDYFSVSTDRKSVNVEARYSSVNKTSTPLSSRQSALIIHSIESATANSLFPALQLRRTFNIDTPPGEIKITDKTDWESIKQSFCEWIPFNEDETRPLDTETRSKAYQCGVQTTKTSLELPYKSFKKEFREPEVKNKILQNTEKIPADIHERFLDLDHWTVVEVPTFMINTKSSIASTNNSDYNEIKDMPDKQEQKFKNYFGAWLYIITSKYNDVKLQEFQTKLKNAYESSTFKGTEEEFYMRCAAHLARTFLQVCAVHHYWIQYIMNNEDINTTFEETLVRIIPSWDFSEEQITIVNILRTVVYNDKNGALEYSKTTNALGDETCVFFDQTERCK